MRISRILALLVVGLSVHAPVRAGEPADSSFRTAVSRFLSRYEARYLRLASALEEARWALLVGEGERAAAVNRVRAAELALEAFVGSSENIELSRTYTRRSKELPETDRLELARIAFLAAGSPSIVRDLVEKRVTTRSEAEGVLAHLPLSMNGTAVSRADVDLILKTERDLTRRRAAWESRYDVGTSLRESLVRLRWLENEIVRTMGSGDAFAYRTREYGLAPIEMQRLLEGVLRDLRPLQIELHTYLRYELARYFEQPVPDLIPVHWLPDATGADGSGIEAWIGFAPWDDLRVALASLAPRELVERADRLWTGLGIAALPQSFFERSVFAAAQDSTGQEFVLQHVDSAGDQRAHFTAHPDAEGLRRAFDLVGEAHCAQLTVRPGVPELLRRGPNRAFFPALAKTVTHCAMRTRSLRSAGLDVSVGDDAALPRLLGEALGLLMPVVYSAGTLSGFEREIYREGLAPELWNKRWWELAALYQGIAPPAPRDERWCDPAAIEQMYSAPAQGYDRAFEELIAFELFDHIARKILDRSPADVDGFERTEVGSFIASIARFGATVDWRIKLRQKIGYEISARPIVEYFEPLREWLARQNEGRRVTLKDL